MYISVIKGNKKLMVFLYFIVEIDEEIQII